MKGRALPATFIVLPVQGIAGVVALFYEPKGILAAIIALLIILGVAVGVPLVVIRRVLNASLWQALRAWLLPTLLVPALMVPLTFFVIKPLFCEAFKIPANSMAPTILGKHLTDVCPTCGRPAFGSPPQNHEYPYEPLMICEGFHVHTAKTTSDKGEGDRVLAMKILRPRRWDLSCFVIQEIPR